MDKKTANRLLQEGIERLSTLAQRAPIDPALRIAYLKLHARDVAYADMNIFSAKQLVDGQVASPNKQAITEHIGQVYSKSLAAQKHFNHTLNTVFQHLPQGGRVSILPLSVASEMYGLEKSFLFRVDSKQGQPVAYVDDFGNAYSSFQAWQTQNHLPAGNVWFPKDGRLFDGYQPAQVASIKTPQSFIQEALAMKQAINDGVPMQLPKYPQGFQGAQHSLLAVQTAYLYQHADQYAHANAALAFYSAGDSSLPVAGIVLQNAIGAALHLKPDATTKSRNDDVLRYSGKSLESIMRVQTAIEAAGGKPAAVKILPLVIKNPEFGFVAASLFRVNSKQGENIIDDQGLVYANLQDWQQHNTLPSGQVVYPKNGHLTLDQQGNPILDTIDTPNHSLWQRQVKPVLNGGALVGAVALGAATIVGTGGAAAPWVLWGGAALAGYSLATSGNDLHHQLTHGVAFDLHNEQIRNACWGVAGGVTGLAAVGAGLRLTQMAGKSVLSLEAGNTAAHIKTAHVANVLDQYVAGASIIDSAQQMTRHYQDMTPAERSVHGALGVVIPSALFAIGVKQSGGVRASLDPFHVPANNLQHSVPTQASLTHDLRPANPMQNQSPSEILHGIQQTAQHLSTNVSDLNAIAPTKSKASH